jgi:PIN domain nuclease of toxin-antitoxin system
LDGSPRLSPHARRAASEEDVVLVASAVSAWEFANKARIGKWPDVRRFAENFIDLVTAERFELLSITPEHAQLAGLLPGAHRDPFDRMLAAQSQIEGMPLVTADPVFKAFGTKVIW